VLLLALAAGASLAAGAVLADRSATRSGGIQAAAIAVVVAAAFVVAFVAKRQVRRTKAVPPRRVATSVRTAELVIATVDEQKDDEADLAAADLDELSGAIVQRLIRSRTDDGERVDGWLRANLQPQERNITMHVAFCPALDESPRLNVRQLSGPPSRIKAAQILPYGLRLDVKRVSAATEAAEVVITFSAVANVAAKE
jgi:hypothetical protein